MVVGVFMRRILWLACWGCISVMVRGIENVPQGSLLWLQGYDLNPPTLGFRVDGQLRVESADEPQTVGVHLSSGKLTNSTTGVILVNHGPGGLRFIEGDLENHGRMTLNAVLLYTKNRSEFVQRGEVQLGAYSGIALTGRAAVLRQVAGEIRFTDRTSRLEFYSDSEFRYEGGMVLGEPLIAASHARLVSPIEGALSLRFGGLGSTLEGHLTTNLVVRLIADYRLGAASLRLTNVQSLEGLVELFASRGVVSPGASLALPSSGFTNTPHGILRILQGSDPVEVLGDLANEGSMDVQSPLRMRAQTTAFTNRGSILIGSGGSLDCETTLVQSSGLLTVLTGGELVARGGLTLLGGSFQSAGSVFGTVSNQSVATVFQDLRTRVLGDWIQGDEGTLRLMVQESTTEPEIAALEVTGSFEAHGTLDVRTVPGAFLTAGDSLSLVRAQRINGWFDRLLLPRLGSGLTWAVIPSENEVRLVVRAGTPPLALELVRTLRGVRLQLTGPVTTGFQAVIRSGDSNGTWTTFHQVFPFAGLTSVPISPSNVPDTEGLRLFQAELIPVDSDSSP
jgi:hypothetical protein